MSEPASLVLPPPQRRLVTFVLMASTFMVVLDTTIANVALPHMQAQLSATPESIAWVLTSYILASAIALPLTGWLSDRIGRRTLLTVSLLGFTVSSALCGLAVSLPMMIAARLVQGVAGAFLSPMSQAIMYDINPPEGRVKAMTLWGMTIMIGPITGPVLGGWITDNWDWRWVFYINLPIGLAAAAGAWALLSDVAMPRRRFDTLGFVLLGLALGGMQLLLDRGPQLDWFDATEIWAELAIAAGAAWMFVIHTVTARDPLVPPGLFKDRNFVMAIVAMTVTGGILMAGAALVAPMLQRLLNYPVLTAGLVTAPRGLGTMIGMLIAGRLSGRVDPRVIIASGMALLAVSLWMMTRFDLGMDRGPVLWSGLVQGLGLGFTVLPMNLLAMATLAQRLRTDAASLYNLARSIGGSIAISVMTALIASNVQVNHVELGGRMTGTRLPFLNQGLIEQLGLRGENLTRMLDAEVNRQSLMIAYVDDYWVMMWAAILVLPLVLLMRGVQRGAGGVPPDAGH